MTIAIVEDDLTLREGLVELFTGEGYAARTAKSLWEAGKLGEADLWLIDVMLPDGSGLGLVRRLRDNSAVPILILTALDAEDSVIEGLRAGADDYVVKPFRSGELLARVEANLRRVLPQTSVLQSGDVTYSLPDERVRLEGQDAHEGAF